MILGVAGILAATKDGTSQTIRRMEAVLDMVRGI
jgi:hypothetical protein